MSDYTKATNFTAKDSLPTGNSGKIVKGAEIDTEFTAIASAIASKADINSPTFTGTPAAPTATSGSNTTQIATTSFVKTAVDTAVATLGTMSTQNKTAVDITGGTIVGITDLTVADGGTGRSTLTANAVLVGNGTSGINSISPSTAGNTLTSDGTNWTSTVPPFTKSAWVYYDGAIVSSYNVASVTNPGTGLYTITFTNAFSNANYMALGTGQANSSSTTQGLLAVSQNSVSKAAGSLQVVRARTDNGAVEDGPFYFYFFGS